MGLPVAVGSKKDVPATFLGPPAQAVETKIGTKKIVANAQASLRRNERAVNAMRVFMVTSCECTQSSSLARRTAKAKSLKRRRDFPPRTGSARKAARCCAESKTRP